MATQNVNLSPTYHDHAADNVLLNGLIIADGIHVNAADNIDLPAHFLAGLDGYFVHAAEACDVSPSWHATTLQLDGVSHPYLPALELSAQSGVRLDLEEQLPGVKLTDMRAGARLDSDAKLSVLELAATFLSGSTASLDERLPDMRGAGRFGAHTADDLMLPDMRLSISMVGDNMGWLDKALPGLTIAATGSTPVLATLDKDLPALEITASAVGTGVGQLDQTLPALTIVASALAGASGTLNCTLPALELSTDAGLYGDAMSLNAMLPAVVMAPIGTGAFGGQASTLSDDARFAGYVMRYRRAGVQ